MWYKHKSPSFHATEPIKCNSIYTVQWHTNQITSCLAPRVCWLTWRTRSAMITADFLTVEFWYWYRSLHWIAMRWRSAVPTQTKSLSKLSTKLFFFLPLILYSKFLRQWWYAYGDVASFLSTSTSCSHWFVNHSHTNCPLTLGTALPQSWVQVCCLW